MKEAVKSSPPNKSPSSVHRQRQKRRVEGEKTISGFNQMGFFKSSLFTTGKCKNYFIYFYVLISLQHTPLPCRIKLFHRELVYPTLVSSDSFTRESSNSSHLSSSIELNNSQILTPFFLDMFLSKSMSHSFLLLCSHRLFKKFSKINITDFNNGHFKI